MIACVPITREEIRAEVWLGDVRLAKTPFVLSFNVNESRGQISKTFSVTFEMIGGTAFPLGANLVIKAGTKNNIRTVFTGVLDSATAQPAFGKPSYFTISLGGRGVLSVLENKKFSRRLPSEGQGVFCLITGGSANRPTSYYTLDKKVRSGNHQMSLQSPDPAKGGENSPLIVHRESGENQGSGGLPVRLAGRSSSGTTGEEAGGLNIHTHESTDEGGPAFAVYSAD